MSNTDRVYEMLKNGSMPFTEITEKLIADGFLRKERAGDLFYDMNLDKRFIGLKGNVWDLSSRYTYSQIVNPVECIDDDDDENEEEDATSDETEYENPDSDEDDEAEDDEEKIAKAYTMEEIIRNEKNESDSYDDEE